MIKSMTGFSKVELAENGYVVSIEIKSLNGRNLDFNIRLPRQISNFELDVRNAIRKKVHRGNLSVNLSYELESGQSDVRFDFEKAGQIYDEIVELNDWLDTGSKVSIDNLLQYSQSFQAKTDDENNSKLWKIIEKALTKALNDLDEMKRKEGQNIYKDIQSRIKKFDNVVKEIEKIGLERIPQEQERYKEKIARLFENDEIDEQRLQTEIVLMADKLDISEEAVRLYSHIKLFNETLKGKEPSGRKLNFLLQEMHREINTIGTKASNSTISHKVVNLKEEIERIREQIQNVE